MCCIVASPLQSLTHAWICHCVCACYSCSCSAHSVSSTKWVGLSPSSLQFLWHCLLLLLFRRLTLKMHVLMAVVYQHFSKLQTVSKQSFPLISQPVVTGHCHMDVNVSLYCRPGWPTHPCRCCWVIYKNAQSLYSPVDSQCHTRLVNDTWHSSESEC